MPWRKSNTPVMCCWYKFSEFKSLESSDSVQHAKGHEPQIQEDNSRAAGESLWQGTVAHQSVLDAFHNRTH